MIFWMLYLFPTLMVAEWHRSLPAPHHACNPARVRPSFDAQASQQVPCLPYTLREWPAVAL